MKRRVIFLSILLMEALLHGRSEAAQFLTGYQCLSVRLTPAEAADPNFMLTVRRDPSGQAPILGTAGALLIASNPLMEKNGFIQIIRPDGVPGWVPASSTKPWHSANPNSNAKCYPQILDNGRVGFTTK